MIYEASCYLGFLGTGHRLQDTIERFVIVILILYI